MRSHPDDLHKLLQGLIEPLVATDGLDLEALEVSLVGRRRRVNVVVDGDDGVDLDRCAELSHEISAVLDANDDVLGSGPYTLEVSSPGVTRPLTLPRHWRRNVGRLVRVVRSNDDVTGRITSANESSATLDVGGAERTVPYADVVKAKIQVEFRRQDREQ